MLFKIRNTAGDIKYIEVAEYEIRTRVVQNKIGEYSHPKLEFKLQVGMLEYELGVLDLNELLDYCSNSLFGTEKFNKDTELYLDGFVGSISDFVALQKDYLSLFRDLKYDGNKRRELLEYVVSEYNSYLKEIDRSTLSTYRSIFGE